MLSVLAATMNITLNQKAHRKWYGTRQWMVISKRPVKKSSIRPNKTALTHIFSANDKATKFRWTWLHWVQISHYYEVEQTDKHFTFHRWYQHLFRRHLSTVLARPCSSRWNDQFLKTTLRIRMHAEKSWSKGCDEAENFHRLPAGRLRPSQNTWSRVSQRADLSTTKWLSFFKKWYSSHLRYRT